MLDIEMITREFDNKALAIGWAVENSIDYTPMGYNGEGHYEIAYFE